MLVAAIADDKAATFTCRKGCGEKIKKGHVVLHLKLGSSFPYDARHHYFHLQCMAETISEAEELVPVDADWITKMREKMIETGQFLVDV